MTRYLMDLLDVDLISRFIDLIIDSRDKNKTLMESDILELHNTLVSKIEKKYSAIQKK